MIWSLYPSIFELFTSVPTTGNGENSADNDVKRNRKLQIRILLANIDE